MESLVNREKQGSRMSRKPRSFSSLLVANRGEIACRIFKSAKRLGYKTIAVYSQPDRNALHVESADESIAIGGTASADSYLSIDKIISACKKSGAEAIHPGYGFLSENAAFARACRDNGIRFIGPSPEAIEAMGNKSLAKEAMIKAGVPCVPGYQGKRQDKQFLLERAKEIGYPLMIKAEAGGGGRGLRIARNKEELAVLIDTARQEAERAFGCGNLLLEKALLSARHVEIQVFGDSFGNVVHIGERDCSIQRRHQKVFEECPSPAVNAALRERMGSAACLAASSIGYEGAGTVEFLLDQDGQFYFLEMNTRLQVEHPVTELVYGIDLVEWQLKVAAGEPLPLEQKQLIPRAHAIEARLYAEDPQDNFQAQVGDIFCFRPPDKSLARTDHGLKERDELSPFYDGMLAKIICTAETRDASLRKLAGSLSDTVLLGLKTNREFLMEVLETTEFQEGHFNTRFIEDFWKAQRSKSQQQEQLDRDAEFELAAMACLILIKQDWQTSKALSDELFAWSNTKAASYPFKMQLNDKEILDMLAHPNDDEVITVTCRDKFQSLRLIELATNSARFFSGEKQQKVHYAYSGDKTIYLSSHRHYLKATDLLFQPRHCEEGKTDGSVLSPTNGLLASMNVTTGQMVEKGQVLFTIDAMKLLQSITAPQAGKVESVCARAGNQVKAKQLIVKLSSIELEKNLSASEVRLSEIPIEIEQ